MKKFGILSILLVFAMIFTACSAEEETTSHRKRKKSVEAETTSFVSDDGMFCGVADAPSEEMAAKCVAALISAGSAEEMTQWLTEDSEEYAPELMDVYENLELDTKAKFMDRYNDYQVFSVEMYHKGTQELYNQLYCMLQPNGEGYLLCCAPDKVNAMTQHYTCGSCGGAGCITIGSPSVCGQCGGTGMWYNPSVYYDFTLNMMMGQYQGCPGCGGAGSFGGTSTVTCSACNGQGHTFP